MFRPDWHDPWPVSTPRVSVSRPRLSVEATGPSRGRRESREKEHVKGRASVSASLNSDTRAQEAKRSGAPGSSGSSGRR